MKLENIDVNSFVKTIWISTDYKNRWQDKLRRIAAVRHQAEIEMVSRGNRPATTVNLAPQTFENDFELFSKSGLVFLPIRRTKRYEGFAHKHTYTTGQDPDSMVYGVVARRLTDAEAFKEYHLGEVINHKEIGRLLGYPDCCLDFFDRVWTQEGYVDTIYHQALNTPGAQIDGHTIDVAAHPFCNQAMRYFGVRITSHLSCSCQCQNTIEWGKTWLEVMNDIDPQAAADAMELLSMPFEWDALKGIVIVRTPLFHGIANTAPYYPKHLVRFAGEVKDVPRVD